MSSNAARDALVRQLVASGQATYGGLVPLENAYNTPTTTTGDHDGFAVVLVLTGSAPLQRRELAMGALAPTTTTGDRQQSACAATDVGENSVRGRTATSSLTVIARCRTNKT